jgi:hypothetical protein
MFGDSNFPDVGGGAGKQCSCDGLTGLGQALRGLEVAPCPVHAEREHRRLEQEREVADAVAERDRIRDTVESFRAEQHNAAVQAEQDAADAERAEALAELEDTDPLLAALCRATGRDPRTARRPSDRGSAGNVLPLNASADQWANHLGVPGAQRHPSGSDSLLTRLVDAVGGTFDTDGPDAA